MKPFIYEKEIKIHSLKPTDKRLIQSMIVTRSNFWLWKDFILLMHFI